MTKSAIPEFNVGELFIYRKAPGTYELGVVKRDRGDGTYACYYSQGVTAAVTPVHFMRKLENARWAPIIWANLWGGNRLVLDDLLCVIPSDHIMTVSQNDVHVYVGPAVHVPDLLRGLRVIGLRSAGWMVDVEVCDE